MTIVYLRPMTADAYEKFLGWSIPDYAAEKAKAGDFALETALAQSAAEFKQLLPAGIATKDNYLYSIFSAEGIDVGMVWIAINAASGESRAFIYDLYVEPTFRSRGYGTAALFAIEDEARRLGAKAIGLHVFGHNTRAQALYTRIGYQPTSIQMRKPL